MSLKTENVFLKPVNQDQINIVCHAAFNTLNIIVFTCESVDMQPITYLISNMAY